MPGTQRPYRPYFYNFLTAFRVHHAFRSAATSSSPTTSSTAAAFAMQQQQQQQQQQQPSQIQQQQQASSYSTSATSSSPTTSAPWPIPHKSAPTSHNPLSPTSGVSAAFSPPSAHHRHAHTATTAAATSPVGPASAAAGFGTNGSGSGPRTGRRGSDASSESGGFRERGGGEAWFVGGKTASGEERFYRLGMARRDRSGERASVDQMSL